MSEWRPIETAPESDLPVLICVDGLVGEAFYLDQDDGDWTAGWWWSGTYPGHGVYDGDVEPLNPTHWMPMPEPPN